MPLIGIALGKVNFAELSAKIGDAEIKYGSFIQTVIDFVIVALCIFVKQNSALQSKILCCALFCSVLGEKCFQKAVAIAAPVF